MKTRRPSSELGASAINVWVNHDQANTDSIAKLLDGATGVHFGGTSAGAAVMSAVMITGDERHPGGDRRDTTTQFMTIARDNIATTAGFGLISNAIIDQHFLRRKRHNRLMSLVLEQEPHTGAGIDESTAIIVRPDGTWRIAGASAVVVYDARSASATPSSAHVLGGANLRMHVLPAGSTFDPRTGAAFPPHVL